MARYRVASYLDGDNLSSPRCGGRPASLHAFRFATLSRDKFCLLTESRYIIKKTKCTSSTGVNVMNAMERSSMIFCCFGYGFIFFAFSQ